MIFVWKVIEMILLNYKKKCSHGNQKQIWTYNNDTKHMKHANSGQCMTADKQSESGKLTLAPCEEGNQAKQRWYFERPMLI